MKTAWNIAKRESARIAARKFYVFMLLVWPVAYAFLSGYIYISKVLPDMPAAVCDRDNSSMSRTFTRYLDATRSLKVEYRVQNEYELKKLIQEQKIEAGVYIPKDFSKNIKLTKGSAVTAYVNGANLLIGNLTSSEIRTVAGTISAGARMEFLRKNGSSGPKSSAEFMPVAADNFKLFNPGINYVDYLMPGVWGTILQQLLLSFGALLIVCEKEEKSARGLFELSGGSPLKIVAGKFMPYTAVHLIIFALYDLVFFPYFDIPVRGGLWLLLLTDLLMIFSSLSMGLLISVFAKTGIDSMKGVLLTGAPGLILSGYIWPLAYIPLPIRIFSYTLPLTHYLRASVIIAGYGAGLDTVSPQLLYMLLIGSVCVALSCLKLRADIKNV